MPSTAEPIIAQVQRDFQDLLEYVTGPATRTSTAYEVERTLFRRLLAMGAVLLRLFFVTRAAVRPAEPVCSPEGTRLKYHDLRPTTYYSVFGKLSFDRHAYTAPGQSMVYPLDARLSLPERCYSELLREWMSYGTTDESYRESRSMLERILGHPLSLGAIETTVVETAVDVASYYEQLPARAISTHTDTILVVQADGKGVPMLEPVSASARRGKGHPTGTKEAVVTVLYTIAPYVRTPAEVVAALLKEELPQEFTTRPQPVGKQVRATLEGKAVALTRLTESASQRDGAHIEHRVALTDGAEALQERLKEHLPGYTLGLDIIHATEYLWDAANALLGEQHPERTAWVRERLMQLLEGKVNAVIVGLEQAATDSALTPTQRKALERTAGYYRRNEGYMRYDEYLWRGWPIGTGVVEGACGHLVKDRMQQAGMRWTKTDAQAVLDLRAVRLNGDWDDYCQFHREQQHQRLYGSSLPLPSTLEDQALELAA